MPGLLYTKASKIIEQRKQLRKSEMELRRAEVFSAVPRIAEIEAELGRYGIRMLEKIASGDCNENEAVAGIMAENRQFMEERSRLLSENGFPVDYFDEKPYCPICNDTGYIGADICKCLKKEIAAYAFQDANMTENLVGQTFDKFRLDYYSYEYVEEYGASPRDIMEAILKECKSFAGKFPNVNDNLLFCGSCGLGKTFLSSAIANELLDRGFDVLYVSCNALFPILEDMHFGRDVNERSEYIVKKLSECELLILDDLGSEFVTQFTSAELFRIINNRLLSDSKMIISTNLNRSMLAKTYNERIASRITGAFAIYEFLGDDIRRIKKLEENV